MKNPTRESLFKAVSKKMREEFEEIRSQVPHAGEGGQEAENIVKKFLKNYLPKRFDVTGGFIIDKADAVSTQQDVIIYDAFNCPIYRAGDRTMIIPNDNVAAVIEVKYKLTIENLKKSLQNIHSLRKFSKTPFLPGDVSPDLSHTYSCIFAFSSEISEKTVINIWKKQVEEDNTNIFNSCNLIIILDDSIFTTITQLPDEGIVPCNFGGYPNTAPIGTKFGICYFGTGERTLDVSMRLLIPHLMFFWHKVAHPGFNFSEFTKTLALWIAVKK